MIESTFKQLGGGGLMVECKFKYIPAWNYWALWEPLRGCPWGLGRVDFRINLRFGASWATPELSFFGKSYIKSRP